MKIKMKTTQYGSEDGFIVKLFNAGETYEVAENLGFYFIRWAKAEADAKAAEEAKRVADKKHRGKIDNEILDALAMIGIDKGISIQLGKLIIEAIANGKIPHVKITY